MIEGEGSATERKPRFLALLGMTKVIFMLRAGNRTRT
jgi:hypothetical protein